jgi:RiboL-PSP-HEPN
MTKKISPPIEQIEVRFGFNIERVNELITLYSETKNEKHYKDVLRSAVVLLHASLEDLLREMIRIRATDDPTVLLDQLQFPNPKDASRNVENIKVSGLNMFRGKSVDELINICISNHLDRRSFNSKEDIIAALGPIGLQPNDYSTYYAEIDAAVKRRHKIVHESDRNSHGTDSHGKLIGIGAEGVSGWVDAVKEFGLKILADFKARGEPSS